MMETGIGTNKRLSKAWEDRWKFHVLKAKSLHLEGEDYCGHGYAAVLCQGMAVVYGSQTSQDDSKKTKEE